MEGKRFGVGLAAGLLVGLALVAVSGGFGSTPLAQFSAPGAAETKTIATSTTTLTTSSTTIPTATYTVTATTVSGGTSTPSSATNGTGALSTSTTTASITATTTFSTTSVSAATTTSSPPGNQSGATNSNQGVTDGSVAPRANYGPSRLVSITQQPLLSNAEIIAPILVAFLLGALLYRVTIRERERPDAEA